MAHAVSLTYARFDHMSATAVAMTTLLHAAVAFALWWISPLHQVDPYEDAVEVTMENAPVIPPSEIPTPSPPPDPPTPEPPKPEPPPSQAASSPSPPAPAPPVRMGLAPVGPDSDQRADPGVEKPGPPKPEMPAEEATRPDPPKPEPKEQQQALAVPPPPPPPPPPSLEQALPPVEAPPPPLTSREIPQPPPPAVKAPPPPQPPPQPTQRAQPAPRPAPMPQHLQSSPLSHLPQPRTPVEQQASRQAPTFQNPADMYGQKRAENAYLWLIARKVSAHQEFVGNVSTEAGTVELRLTIARDGQLVAVAVNRSSGIPSLDNTSMNIVRAAGPYAPLPADITGAQHTFILPLYYRRN